MKQIGETMLDANAFLARIKAQEEEQANERREAMLKDTGGDDSYEALYDWLLHHDRKALLRLIPKDMTVSEFATVSNWHSDDEVRNISIRRHQCAHCEPHGGECRERSLYSVVKDGHWPVLDRAGKLLRYEQCDRWQRYEHFELLGHCGVPIRYREFDLASYKPQDPSQESALEECAKYVKSFRFKKTGGVNNSGGIVFEGPPGTGKTHLACMVFRALYLSSFEQRFRGQFWFFPKLVDKLRLQEDRLAREELGFKLTHVPLLILDDVGACAMSEYEQAELTVILNERSANAYPTLVTSNDPLDTYTQRIGARIVSRLAERNLRILLEGKDRRIELASDAPTS